jgi:tRNA(adenine34) deaminase
LTLTSDLAFLGLTMDLARQAADAGEVPIGALVTNADGQILSKAHNLMETRQDATAHAECLAIQAAAKALDSWRLDDCTLFVTLEPCPMCAGAILNSRLGRVVFGAWDHRLGACGTHWNIPGENPIHRQVEVVGGLLQDECAGLLKSFFKELRDGTRLSSRVRRMPETL